MRKPDTIEQITADWQAHTRNGLEAEAKRRVSQQREWGANAYADQIASELPAEIDRQVGNIPGFAVAARERVRQRDRHFLKSLRPFNKFWRRVFSVETGVALPKTEGGTLAAVREWYGAAEWDAEEAAIAADRDRERAEREAKELAANLASAMKELFKCAPPGGGLARAVTLRELVTEHLSAGYELEQSNRGPFPILYLTNGSRRLGPFKTKVQIAAVEQLASELLATSNKD